MKRDEIYNNLKKISEVDRDKSLASMTTLKIGGNASFTAYPDSVMAIDTLMRFLKDENIPYFFIGKGSDLLCSDKDYKGVIIRLDKYFNDVIITDDQIVAQSGASLIALATMAMQNGLSGLEFASGIPGTVGGATFMNAGAYLSSMSEIIKEVTVYGDGSIFRLNTEQCHFTYRHSIFHDHPDWVILSVSLQLKHEDQQKISDLMDNRRQRRLATQPLSYPSCGSVFRNPKDINAWQLVDGIGYRGKQYGAAKVSEKHSNFIINTGGAKAEDYLRLVQDIQAKVYDKYQIRLQTEMEKFNW